MKISVVGLSSLLFMLVGQVVFAQESIQYVRPATSYSLRTVPSVTVSDPAQPAATLSESATVVPPAAAVTQPVSAVAPVPTLRATAVKVPAPAENVPLPTVKSATSDLSCTKVTSGGCTIFSCTDGTKVNTCDLECKDQKSSEPALPGSVSTDEPKITGFFPMTGNAGTEVRVYITKGKKNFSGPDSIEVGGVPVKMTMFSNVPGSKADFVITFSLPVGAQTGKIVVKKPGTFANPAVSEQDFVVVPEQEAPTIVSIKPLAGYPGQEVSLELLMGSQKFSGVDSVEIDGVPAPIIAQTNIPSLKPNGRKITFIIPDGAKTGKVTVTKKSLFGSVSSAQDFVVVTAQDAPTILSFSPTSGKAGDTVAVKIVLGKKSFSGLDEVSVGGAKAEVVSQFADTSGVRVVTIRVPSEAKTGKVVLKKPSLFSDVASANDFVVEGTAKSILQKIFSFFKKK